jgi:hypothetical protein
LLEQTNLIIHPHVCQPASLLQLDDLDADMLVRVRPLAFLVIATSPAGRQAWVETEGCDDDFCRRVKRVTGADLGANGQARIAGSMNIKRQYEPYFPTVRIIATLSRPKVGPEDFRTLGLVAPPEEPRPRSAPRTVPRTNARRPRAYPSYEMCLERSSPYARGQPGSKRRGLLQVLYCH